jgi:hypothetical protein
MSQAELDFVDVDLLRDQRLYIDPFALSLRSDPWSIRCTRILVGFFQQLIDEIRRGRFDPAFQLLRFLREPNETRLGLSRGQPQGAGIGEYQAGQILEALRDSQAVAQGFIQRLEEAELLVDGIGPDKISDLTTNIIRLDLAEYTTQQAELLGVPTLQSPLPPIYDPETNRWEARYFQLPRGPTGPVLLVPKTIVRRRTNYDPDEYYNTIVVEFLQAEELRADSSLVQLLRNGARRVTKKDVKSKFPKTKDYLYTFSRDHPDLLEQYRVELTRLESRRDSEVDEEDQRAIAQVLRDALLRIPPGTEAADDYHRLMIGMVEFVFFPQLLHPQKETPLHEGRKRIDILTDNGARPGTTFNVLHANRGIQCPYVPIECKNYTGDPANPELDQLSGRFSVQRGKVGLLFCRRLEDRALFLQRCKDTLRDDRGLILPFDDESILGFLDPIAEGNRAEVDVRLTQLVREVWV